MPSKTKIEIPLPAWSDQIFTRRDLVELSGFNENSVKAYLRLYFAEMGDRDRNQARVAKRFTMREALMFRAMACFSKYWHLEPRHSIPMANRLSGVVFDLMNRAARSGNFHLDRVWVQWFTGDEETAGLADVLPEEIFFGDVRDGLVIGHVDGGGFGVLVIPAGHVWRELIWPVLRQVYARPKTARHHEVVGRIASYWELGVPFDQLKLVPHPKHSKPEARYEAGGVVYE